MIHVLAASQIIATSMKRAWDFFSNPRNLSKITPPELDFQILSTLPERIHSGIFSAVVIRWFHHRLIPIHPPGEQTINPFRKRIKAWKTAASPASSSLHEP